MQQIAANKTFATIRQQPPMYGHKFEYLSSRKTSSMYTLKHGKKIYPTLEVPQEANIKYCLVNVNKPMSIHKSLKLSVHGVEKDIHELNVNGGKVVLDKMFVVSVPRNEAIAAGVESSIKQCVTYDKRFKKFIYPTNISSHQFSALQQDAAHEYDDNDKHRCQLCFEVTIGNNTETLLSDAVHNAAFKTGSIYAIKDVIPKSAQSGCKVMIQAKRCIDEKDIEVLFRRGDLWERCAEIVEVQKNFVKVVVPPYHSYLHEPVHVELRIRREKNQTHQSEPYSFILEPNAGTSSTGSNTINTAINSQYVPLWQDGNPLNSTDTAFKLVQNHKSQGSELFLWSHSPCSNEEIVISPEQQDFEEHKIEYVNPSSISSCQSAVTITGKIPTFSPFMSIKSMGEENTVEKQYMADGTVGKQYTTDGIVQHKGHQESLLTSGLKDVSKDVMWSSAGDINIDLMLKSNNACPENNEESDSFETHNVESSNGLLKWDQDDLI